MKKILLTAAFSLLLVLPLLPVLPAAHGTAYRSDIASALLRNRLEKPSARIMCAGRVICSSKIIPKFYANREYRLAWSSEEKPLPQADALIKFIRNVDREALNPLDYHLDILEYLQSEMAKATARAEKPLSALRGDFDLLMTDAFLLCGSHIVSGRVDPEKIHEDWFARKRYEDLASVLQVALDTNSVEETLRSLIPKHPGYERLKKALLDYRRMAAGDPWPVLPDGPTLRKDDQGEAVVTLRKRLALTGDLAASQSGGDLFDDALEAAVIKFQARHGIDPDGAVGHATRRTLNTPAEVRVRQVELNLERWRWLPAELGRRHVLVNIAGFSLEVVENDRVILPMKVIVGKNYQRTPVFSGKMTYVEINPYWNVPASIATKELLPKIQKDARYLKKEKMRVIRNSDSKRIDFVNPGDINWSELSEGNFPYRLRQEPGPKNPLGRIKFMFPNKYGVYLHDTSEPALFERTRREFSHGCIRIEKPLDFAEYVLRGDLEWTRENIEAAIAAKKTRVVTLPEPIPVHILYWTAWVDEDGTAHFRNDIYERDEDLARALKKGTLTP
ncbi:MAG TPA: L,D-transpeptidase family protein [Syntrophales bacterium]|nr:L,D-transpeptidase family protein [Syntrophales bacterium]HOX94745.1 L,D-transpeptidase family protein [Syntrophales bacterium]HPI56027.1 L,D-transpeptidase family protein [Syntrophales bacterium]HPN24083.1 L,D-transpeptidase family protein [Syntrophales bacterium]HQM28362.1 L,D-transpeptidase family protein [Syntrophales bacterium]